VCVDSPKQRASEALVSIRCIFDLPFVFLLPLIDFPAHTHAYILFDQNRSAAKPYIHSFRRIATAVLYVGMLYCSAVCISFLGGHDTTTVAFKKQHHSILVRAFEGVTDVLFRNNHPFSNPIRFDGMGCEKDFTHSFIHSMSVVVELYSFSGCLLRLISPHLASSHLTAQYGSRSYRRAESRSIRSHAALSAALNLFCTCWTQSRPVTMRRAKMSGSVSSLAASNSFRASFLSFSFQGLPCSSHQ